MAASDSDLILNVLSFAVDKAEASSDTPLAILKAMNLAAGAGFATGGGRLISASVNGKSFAYSLDARFSLSDLMTAIRGARALLAQYDADALSLLLATPAETSAQIRFC